MEQFTVYENPNSDSKSSIPYLLNVQNDLLNNLNTRVVVPMCYSSSMNNKQLEYVSPVFKIKGRNCIMLTPQLAGIPIANLGQPVVNLTEFRSDIIAALDFLIIGF